MARILMCQAGSKTFLSLSATVVVMAQVLESFTKYILRDESRSTTNTQLTQKVAALLVDRSADVMRLPRKFQADLLDELKTVSESKVDLHFYV